MGRMKNWLLKKQLTLLDKTLNNDLYKTLNSIKRNNITNTNIKKNTSSKTISSALGGVLKRVGLRTGDSTSSDYEDPEYDFSTIATAYDTDSYIRQGIDKYIDQIFKEGWTIYGKNQDIVSYINLRLSYMAAATNTPIDQFLLEIAEDVVKYSNCIIAKSRASDTSSLPQGVNITGVNGKQPVAGYFCLNVPSMKVKRDANGTVQGWEQDMNGANNKPTFNPEDIIHIYYKREKGNAFGTPLLVPVLDDVRALRQAEENVLKMMYRNIYPFIHATVGTADNPGTQGEIDELQESLEGMEVEGGIATSEKVSLETIALNNVVDAKPYLEYFESRVFSGLGVPEVLFGRGDTSNRSTSDDMTSEMSDRIKAIQKVIEVFFNQFIINELLYEGGYDPLVNEDQVVKFKFKENDLDTKIKKETHAVYLYEHNAITESEMRVDLGRDQLTDEQRNEMYLQLVTKVSSALKSNSNSSNDEETGTKETNNKEQPENQNGKKQSSATKTKNSSIQTFIDLIKDEIESNFKKIEKIIDKIYKKEINVKDGVSKINAYIYTMKNATKVFAQELHINVNNDYIVKVERLISSLNKEIIENIKDCGITSDTKLTIDVCLDIFRKEILERKVKYED